MTLKKRKRKPTGQSSYDKMAPWCVVVITTTQLRSTYLLKLCSAQVQKVLKVCWRSAMVRTCGWKQGVLHFGLSTISQKQFIKR